MVFCDVIDSMIEMWEFAIFGCLGENLHHYHLSSNSPLPYFREIPSFRDVFVLFLWQHIWESLWAFKFSDIRHLVTYQGHFIITGNTFHISCSFKNYLSLWKSVDLFKLSTLVRLDQSSQTWRLYKRVADLIAILTGHCSEDIATDHLPRTYDECR